MLLGTTGCTSLLPALLRPPAWSPACSHVRPAATRRPPRSSRAPPPPAPPSAQAARAWHPKHTACRCTQHTASRLQVGAATLLYWGGRARRKRGDRLLRLSTPSGGTARCTCTRDWGSMGATAHLEHSQKLRADGCSDICIPRGEGLECAAGWGGPGRAADGCFALRVAAGALAAGASFKGGLPPLEPVLSLCMLEAARTTSRRLKTRLQPLLDC